MTECELSYLERRAASEARMAERASCPEAASAHVRLARAYVERAQALRHTPEAVA